MSTTTDIDVFSLHGLARALAEQDFEIIRASWHESLSRMGSFPFKDLPVEIAVAILKLATTKSSAYSVLMRTSKPIAALARLHCVPEQVVLSNSDTAISFFTCISVHPGVGAGVKQLWLLPGLESGQAATAYPAIMKACLNVERLACFPDTLADMCSDTDFRHTSPVDVTFSQPVVPWHWDRLLGARHGARLLNQLHGLRIAGGIESAVGPPRGISFQNLTDLTMSARTTTSVRAYMFDTLRFPRLVRVVVTVPYSDWQSPGNGMDFLMSEPDLSDVRLCIVHCSNKWKEMDVWKEGAHKIWNTGAAEWNARASLNGTQREWM
ncbi:hypothetical protein C8F04DRAFT_346154 [Mycena alexandri]|uniref:Uncharacterized protein n=1 Tax=Mycena alexandri TaxID=1745969 RepID=A0AAD6TH37_9AGAR|nr:hypothetical protein C8F04DRAFT_346154 [Mycena alexandri]